MVVINETMEKVSSKFGEEKIKITVFPDNLIVLEV